MDEKIIKVASFFDYTQAEIAKIALEAEEIECFLSGENLIATYWLYANAIGGIKLYIKESDKERAEAILKATHKPDETDQDTSYDLRCPKCNSSDIDYARYSRWAFCVSILLFWIPITYPCKKYTCRNCGYKWK
ncbi:MAG: DUF2007 domain-containing protein [Phycisphaerae bacterium]|nr:DUF2007 domain-containing protein [Phycisphaerae bacterium]